MAARLTFGTAIGMLHDARLRLGTARSGAAGAAVSVFAIRIAAAAFAYGAQVLAARLMGWDEYGVFATVWVWTAMLGHTLTLGLSQGACRFLPEAQGRGDLNGARGYLAAGALVTLGAAIATALFGLVVLRAAPGFFAEPYRAPLAIAALVLPLFALQDYLEGVARSQNWAVLAIAPPYLLRQIAMMGALLAAVFAGAPARAEVAMACMLGAAALATAMQSVLLLARLRRAVGSGPRRFALRRWLGAVLPIAAIDLATAGFGFVDVVVLGFLMPPAAVGVYFAATRIQQFVVFVHFAAAAATAQRYSAARDDGTALAGLVRVQGQATAAATLVMAIAVVAVSPVLLAMFGSGFGESIPILAVLAAGSVAASLFGPGEDLLTMLGGERLCAAITVAALALAVALCLALIPLLGSMGAALAMACATTLRAAGLAAAARAVHGLATPVWSSPAGAVR